MTAEQQPHEKRCETCNKYASLKCPLESKEIAYDYVNTNFAGFAIQRERISDFTLIIGCASHSSITVPRESNAIEAWAIKGPDGEIVHSAIHVRQSAAKVAAMIASDNRNHNWPEFERRDYRCVRVRIVEVEER